MERHGIHLEEASENEEESLEEAETQGDVDLVRLFKSVLETSSRPRSEVLIYDGSLNAKELIDWINTLDKYFDYEEVGEDKKVKFSITNMTGHASIWWDGIHANKRSKGKKITRARLKW